MSTATLNIEKTQAAGERSEAKKVLVPQLRFPGFGGGWEKIKLGDKIEIVSGFAFKGDLFGDEGRKLVIPKNFKKNGYGNFTPKFTKYTTEECDKKLECIEGDLLVLLTDLTQSCELLGKPLLVKKEDGEVFLNQRVIKINTDKSLERVFLMNFLLTENYHKYIVETSSGTTVRHSSNKIIIKTKLSIPTLPEQQKIASFLSAVDEKIQQLSRKKELLEQYKKGVMQQLFSGKLRFKDENGEYYADWEEKKLGEVGKFYAGGDLDKLNYSKIKSNEFLYPIYANGAGEGIYGYATTFQYKKNSVTVSGRGNLGYANIRTQNFNAIVRLIVIEPKDFMNPKYLEEIINQTKFAIESTGVPQLTVPQIPYLEEQHKIANFLSSIDIKLESVNQQITQTQSFKKGLLQQMFV